MKSLRRIAPLTVGGLIFLVVLYSLGPSAVFSAIARAKPGYIILTSLFFLLPNCLRIYKWRLMKGRMGADITLSETVAAYFSSKFWGTVSPMRSGEVLPAVFGTKGSSRQGKLLSIILYDRVIETAQSLVVFFVFFFLFYKVFFNAAAGYALAGITGVLAVFSFVLFSEKIGGRLLNLAEHVLPAFLKGSARKFKEIAGEFYKASGLCFRPGFSLYILFLTFACWAFDMLFWLTLFRAFSVSIGVWLSLAAVMVYSIAAALAPVPGGLGAAELPFVLILAKLGYTGEAGGIAIAGRVLSTGYLSVAYALSNRLKPVSEASGD